MHDSESGPASGPKAGHDARIVVGRASVVAVLAAGPATGASDRVAAADERQLRCCTTAGPSHQSALSGRKCSSDSQSILLPAVGVAAATGSWSAGQQKGGRRRCGDQWTGGRWINWRISRRGKSTLELKSCVPVKERTDEEGVEASGCVRQTGGAAARVRHEQGTQAAVPASRRPALAVVLRHSSLLTHALRAP